MIFSVIPFKDFEYELQFINYDGMGNEYEIPSAKDCGWRLSIKRPFKLFFAISESPPTGRDTIGNPYIMASKIVIGKPSE